MSKIICDVCGTSYPESANQCPICGCVRSGDAVTVRGDTNNTEMNATGNYTHVKGGRFSKSNVKKRNQGKAVPVAPASPKEDKPKKEGKGDKAMIITVFVLLIAIVAIVIYIAVYFFAPGLAKPDQETTQNTTETTQQTVETTEATVLEVPCEELDVSDTVIELDKAGAALLLNVTPTPEDTTDIITYATSDERVAVVTEDGKVIAAGNGEAIITITCGEITAECRVICTIESDVEETTEPVYSTDDFKLNREDFTLNNYGATWTLYKGEIPADVITWTSDDEKVVTVKDGVVTAVGPGKATISAEYAGIKLECIVRCSDSVKAPAETEPPAEAAYKISATDVTIKVGETFKLTLEDKEGKKVEVTWVCADSKICTVSNGTVTGVAKGTTVVSTTVDGVPYRCTVRVG